MCRYFLFVEHITYELNVWCDRHGGRMKAKRCEICFKFHCSSVFQVYNPLDQEYADAGMFQVWIAMNGPVIGQYFLRFVTDMAIISEKIDSFKEFALNIWDPSVDRG